VLPKIKDIKLKHVLLPISIFSTVLLSGCLEVDNDSNDELVKTLQEQNQILTDNQNQIQTVGLTGLIVDAYDNQPIASAQITVKQGQTTLIENLSVTNGQFQLSDIPSGTDIAIIVSDTNNSFLERAFFLRTNSTTNKGTTSDIGMLSVSEPVTVTLDVTESVNNEVYSSLVFKGYSHSGSSSLINNYVHTSTFAEGIYTIVLPKYLSVGISATLDIDRDGEIDFIASPNDDYYNKKLLINSANSSEHYNIELTPLTDIIEDAKDVEYRISVIDSSANTITGAELSIFDSINDSLITTYDEVTQQYVINAKFQNTLNIKLPSFTSNEISYQSASIQLSDSSDEQLRVYVSNSNNNNSTFYTTNSDVVELVLSPRVITNNSSLEVAYRQTEISDSDQSFSVFYSEPISVNASNVSLTNRYGFSVVEGDTATDDLVIAGTTLITGNIEVPLTVSLSLNNTKLTLTPQETLISGNYYEYFIGTIETLSDGTTGDVYNDNLSFNANYNNIEDFNINDVMLDNESYTTNGVSIRAKNTAGETALNSNYDRYVSMYFPQSIQSLNSFTLRQVQVNEDGVLRTDVRTYTIVSDSNIHTNSYGLMQAASNENIVTDNLSRSVIYSTAISNTQRIYRSGTNEYMSDNLTTSENSITFEYAYETKAGEIFTGNITLPVL
jgi:hypothetical protein